MTRKRSRTMERWKEKHDEKMQKKKKKMGDIITFQAKKAIDEELNY